MKDYNNWLDLGNPYTNYDGVTEYEIKELQDELRIEIEWLFNHDFTGNDLTDELDSLKVGYASRGLEEEYINDVLREYDL